VLDYDRRHSDPVTLSAVQRQSQTGRWPQARFASGDTLLFASESRGAPSEAHARVDVRVRIAHVEGTRSLNIAVAAGIGPAEALRQTAWA
jgi:tRNA(Leu) C34 or U34 (ribose-2'-O)-methylase TrmL